MPGFLTPARRRGVEILDDPATPSHVRDRSMADVIRANTMFGGTRAVLRAFRRLLPNLPRRAVSLDVGTGLGDIPPHMTDEAEQMGLTLTTIGLDVAESLLRSARRRLSGVVAGDALRLPLRDESFDVVMCSQLLHHFAENDARRVIGELHRVSRGWVIVSDLRRSWFAAAGFWIASVALRFHRVTRHDGVTSVLRGFTVTELDALVQQVTGATPLMRRGVFWRVSASWAKHPPSIAER